MQRSLLLLALIFAQSTWADTLIHAGRLIDGNADDARTEMTIRVNGKTIVAVEDGYAAPGPDDSVVDLRDATVVPGLMDMHVHLTGQTSPNSRLQRFCHE